MLNIKELHIGAHVLIDGKRERVRGMDEDNGLIIRFPAEYVLASDIEPIPITPELLSELGFLKMEEHGTVSVWMNRNIRIDIIGERMTAMVGIDFQNCTISPIRYLHEIEQFLYLTTKTELIKE